MGQTLEDADSLRATESAGALRLYASLRDRISIDDDERILWICEQVAPTPPFELEPLLRRVADDATGLVRRAAQHALGTMSFFSGEYAVAEGHWLRGLRASAAERDRIWIRCCLNLAMVMAERRCLFEPLVLTGHGKRAAIAADIPYLRAYAAARSADIAIRLGELDYAEAELAEVEATLPRIEACSERRVVMHEAWTARDLLLRERGDLQGAFAVRMQMIPWLEEYGHVEDALMAEVHIARLELLFDLEPQDRVLHIEEFATLADRFKMGASWHARWRRKQLGLRLRHAAAQGKREAALGYARELLDRLRADSMQTRTEMHASLLARGLADQLDAPELAQEALELASSACLERIVEAHRASREIPELMAATPEESAMLQRYRKRLIDQRRDLLDAIAAHLRPGEPAFDLLARDDLIRLCAWCGRVRTGENTWLPVSHYLPDDHAAQVSHGICETCRDEHFPRN